MTTRRERFEVRIETSAAHVWEMLTTAEGLASWFGTRASIELRVGGDRVVGWGDQQEMSGRITSVDEPNRLVVTYLAGEQEIGAEEWLITSEGTSTRLTLIHTMPDDGIDDWEGFYGDIKRGWRLFLTSLKHALETAAEPRRIVRCEYLPVRDRLTSWEHIKETVATSPELLAGMTTAIEDEPHSLMLVSPDRTLIIDHEGSGDGLVVYVQAAAHSRSDKWLSPVLVRFAS